MKFSVSPPNGMRDFSPKEFELRNYVLNTILKTYENHGFVQIENPVLENINLLTSGQGGENEKMIFKVLKRGDKLNIQDIKHENDLVDLGLRYDLTVPMIRYYSNNMAKLPIPFKVIQTGYVWRAERPQKGRYRQLRQCDIDIIGINSIIAEIELISATGQALINLGFNDFTVRINDRRILQSLAKSCNFENYQYGDVFVILDKLDKIGINGVEQELMKKGFEIDKINNLIYIVSSFINGNANINNIKTIIKNIDEEIIANLITVINTIKKLSNNLYNIVFDLSLVRGMGYYTGQIFEIEVPSYKTSVAGGGRYDKMIEKMTNKNIPACGFSIGFERIVSIMEENNFTVPKTSQSIAVLYEVGKNDEDLLFDFIETLKKEYPIVSIEVIQKNITKQLDKLFEKGIEDFVIFSPDNKKMVIKNLVKRKAGNDGG